MKLVWRECNGSLWNDITWLHYTIPNHICGFRDQEFNQIMDSLGEEVPEYSTDMKSHSAKKSGVCLILHFSSGSCLLKRGLNHDHGGLSHDQGDWTTTFHIIVKGCERCMNHWLSGLCFIAQEDHTFTGAFSFPSWRYSWNVQKFPMTWLPVGRATMKYDEDWWRHHPGQQSIVRASFACLRLAALFFLNSERGCPSRGVGTSWVGCCCLLVWQQKKCI